MTFYFNDYYIPERMQGSIDRYINQHVRPGDFLSAVISNNLSEAVGRADDENMRNLPAYVAFFYNHAPANCWGSVKNMKVWLERG